MAEEEAVDQPVAVEPAALELLNLLLQHKPTELQLAQAVLVLMQMVIVPEVRVQIQYFQT